MSIQGLVLNVRFYSELCILTVDFEYFIHYFSQFCMMSLIFFDIFANVRAGSCYERNLFFLFIYLFFCNTVCAALSFFLFQIMNFQLDFHSVFNKSFAMRPHKAMF